MPQHLKIGAANGALQVGRFVDNAITNLKNVIPDRQMGFAMEGVGDVKVPAENTHAVENKIRAYLSKVDGVNLEDIKEIKDNSKGLSPGDKAKIEKWMYPPSEEKYLKYKDVYDNPKYYNQETGEVIWPPNDGFAEEPVDTILKEGMLIDRYGNQLEASFLQRVFRMKRERSHCIVTKQTITFIEYWKTLVLNLVKLRLGLADQAGEHNL